MERLFRSLKSEWVPNVGYMTAQQAHRDISHYLIQLYRYMLGAGKFFSNLPHRKSNWIE